MRGITTMHEAARTVPGRSRNAAVNEAVLGLTNAPSKPRLAHQGIDASAVTSGPATSPSIVIAFLHEALGTAILCILRYKRHYFMTAGISSHRVKATWLQHVTEGQAHADQLATRIVQLGGEAVFSREPLLNRSDAELVEGNLLAKMITAELLAERSAIHNYRAMIAAIGADDPMTRQVLEGILAQKEKHAENLDGLLRDCPSQPGCDDVTAPSGALKEEL